MPLGNDDYDIVIGVTVDDQTAAGSASVKNSIKKSGDDIRNYSDKQARTIASNTRTTFNSMDRDMSRSATGIVKKLTYVFDQHNFLLRNMARQAGSTTGAIAIGVGKLSLAFGKLGKDTEEASGRSKNALADMKLAVSRLGTDPNAFPAALKAAKDLSAAYEKMGMTGHVASTRAGTALEQAVHKRVIQLQGGLEKARADFDKLRTAGTVSSEKLAGKVNEISASVRNLLGGAKVDSAFFKAFVRAKDDAEKYRLVLDKLGPKAAVAFASNQTAVNKLSEAYVRLESRAVRFIKTQSDKMGGAGTKVQEYQKEIAVLEKGLAKLVGTTGEGAISTGGLSASVVVATAAIAAAVIVIVAIVAAIVAFIAICYKGATAAAAYGNEIYKLSLSTGLSVKTLSALSVIAKETQTDIDSLAKTFARTQIQIQRGIDKPFSESGRALRTLKVDFQELKKANPDQQIFMLAKAFTQLNNQNVRATVAQQIFSRDAERQAKMLEQVAHGFEEAQKKAKRFGLELDESGAVKANKATVAIEDMKLAWEGLWVTLGIKILPQLSILMQDFAESVAKASGSFSFLGGVANAVLLDIRIKLAEMKEFLENPAWAITHPLEAMARARLRVAQEDAAYEAELKRRVDELKRRGLQGDDQYASGRGSKSPLDSLIERVKRLRFEITALQEIGSRENLLRFELEDLEKVKSAFETIFKLRNEMGLVLDQPLPEFRIFGTPEEQRQDLVTLQSYVKQMERMRTIFEGVRKVANEQADALATLARVQQEELMPVVDAGTLAAIKYNTAIRDRMVAERELTADVISETRLRKDAIEDEVGATLKAYMTLQRDLGRSQDKVREQRKEDQIFLKIIRGDIDTEATIREGIRERIGNIQAPIVPDELTTIAAHAATIDLNVASIAEKIGAGVSQTVKTNITTSDPRKYGFVRGVVRMPDGSVKVVSEEDIVNPPDVIKSQTTDVDFLRRKIFNESRERAGGERDAALRAANQRIIDNQMRMEQSLIDLDTDYLDKWSQLQIVRRESARETIVSIMFLENDLRDLSNTNSELYKNTWKEADESRLNSLKGIKEEIIVLQNEIANNGFDQTERLQRARLRGIRDIQEESNKARESIVYNQQIIADQTIYHAERADAAVIDFLAHQRGITEIIADAKVGVIDATFSAIDSGLDRLTAKLGIAGDIVKDLISGFIRLALSPFFKAMFGGQGRSGGFGGFGGFGIPGGGGGQGGISSIPGIITNLVNSTGGGAGVTSPLSVSGVFGGSGAIGGVLHEAGHTGAAVGAAGSITRAGVLSSLAGALPFLGLGIGANVGGQSRFGSILGGAGGLLAGGIGAAFLAPSVFASTGVLGSLGPAALGLLTNPITAIAAGALLVGAILLNRNATRRRNETSREELSQQVIAKLQEMLSDAQSGSLTLTEAQQEFNQLRSEYFQAISGYDSKTKRIATDWWNMPEHPPQVFWKQIKVAAEQNEAAGNIRNRMIPVFGAGGYTRSSSLIKVRPGEGIKYPGSNVIQTVFGQDRGYDTQYMYAPAGTQILNQSEMRGARPFQHGGWVGMTPTRSGELPELTIDELALTLDADGLATIVISSSHFKKAVIRDVKVAKKEKKIA